MIVDAPTMPMVGISHNDRSSNDGEIIGLAMTRVGAMTGELATIGLAATTE